MTDEHTAYTSYIQSKFFRAGVNTHLYIEMTDPTPSDGLILKWMFTFKDLASTHILTDTPALIQFDHSAGGIVVNGSPRADIWSAEAAVFGGHYADYVRELYASEGIAHEWAEL